MSDSGPFEWEEAPDLTVFSEEQLKVYLGAFASEEREVSYRRRVLQGRIDLIRAELVRRGDVSASPGDLARLLLGGQGEPGDPSDIPEHRDDRGSEHQKHQSDRESNRETNDRETREDEGDEGDRGRGMG